MREHVQIHCGRHSYRAARAQQNRLKQVIALSVHHRSQSVGRGRCNENQVPPNSKFHMVGPRPGVFVLREVGMHGVVHQGGQSEGRDEFCGTSRHHHAHFGTAPTQFTGKERRFVCSNAPGDAKHNAAAGQHVFGRGGGQRHGQCN